MEPNFASGVGEVKHPLQNQQTGVGPGCGAQTDLLDDQADEEVTEILVQPLGEVLQPQLLFFAFAVLEGARQGEWLE